MLGRNIARQIIVGALAAGLALFLWAAAASPAAAFEMPAGVEVKGNTYYVPVSALAGQSKETIAYARAMAKQHGKIIVIVAEKKAAKVKVAKAKPAAKPKISKSGTAQRAVRKPPAGPLPPPRTLPYVLAEPGPPTPKEYPVTDATTAPGASLTTSEPPRPSVWHRLWEAFKRY
jgi:hypothetical protein